MSASALARSLVARQGLRDLAGAAATLGFTYAINRHVLLARPRPLAIVRLRHWLERVQRDGYFIVEGYADPSRCARLRDEIDRAFRELPQYVRVRSDTRMFGIENASPLIAEFANDPELRSIAEAHWREDGKTMATLGARLDVREGGLGSGEGWHRDSYFRQFKALLYLTDVDENHGPFQLIRGSDKPVSLLRDGVTARLTHRQTRFSDEQVDALVARDPSRLVTVTGKAGTLILVNTCAIHRGKPITTGYRYALTNYYMPTRTITPERLAHFSPIVPPAARA